MSSSSNTSSSANNSRNHGARAALARLQELRQSAASRSGGTSSTNVKASLVAGAVESSDSEDEGIVRAAPVSVPVDLPFEGVNPNLILKYLKGLTDEQCLNGKRFWQTYGCKWEGLTSGQKNKAAVFFDANISNATRQELLALARAHVHDEVEEEKERAALTNKHDKCRLLHLRADSAYAALWSMAFREWTRSELDAESPPNYFEQLAEAFNNYDLNAYQNAVVVPNAVTAQGTYVARPGMELIARFTHDLNPCAYPRPMRDGAWVRVQLRNLRAKLSVCWSNFKRSGQQDAENLCDEWCNFSTTFGEDVITYAYAVFTEEMLDHMGKRLTDAMQVDTGVLGEISPAVERARKEKRRRATESALQSGNVLAQIGDAIKNGIEKNEALQEKAQKRANKMKMVEMVLAHASDARKERILDKLSVMITDPEDWDIDLAQLLGVNAL